MKTLKKLKTNISNYKKNFFNINEKELTRTSKVLMSIFFITIMFILIQGMSLSLKQAERPSVQYGYQCVEMARQSNKDYQSNYYKFTIYDFENLNRTYNYDISYGSNSPEKMKSKFGKSEVCNTVRLKYLKIINDNSIQNEISQIRLLEDKLNTARFNQKRINKRYSEMLLEKIANQEQSKSILKTNSENAKEELDKYSKEIANIQDIIDDKSNIMNYPKIKDLKLFLEKESNKILDGIDSARKWYTVKRSAQVLAFLIPVWVLFFWLFRRFLSKKHFIFAHLSFYVSNAAALLILIEIIHVIYVVMPKVFLSKLISLLVSLNLGIILNVIGIFFFLGLFGVIIKKVQRNAEKSSKTKDKRVLNVKFNKCWNCASPKKGDKEFCYNCGEKQKTKCIKCNSEILKFTIFCDNCGKEQKEEEQE